jgi:hypothetical protein
VVIRVVFARIMVQGGRDRVVIAFFSFTPNNDNGQ